MASAPTLVVASRFQTIRILATFVTPLVVELVEDVELVPVRSPADAE
jgi:hypothetical protein